MFSWNLKLVLLVSHSLFGQSQSLPLLSFFKLKFKREKEFKNTELYNSKTVTSFYLNSNGSFCFLSLHRIVARASKNLMSTQSLGIVFGPTLLRAENESGNMAVHMVYQNQIAELMLSEYDRIFSWLTDTASYWVRSHLSRCLIFLHFCKHISEIFFSFQATDASFCENLMTILCLSSKHLNKIVDNICLYVFYINPFTAMPSSTSRHTLWMLCTVK